MKKRLRDNLLGIIAYFISALLFSVGLMIFFFIVKFYQFYYYCTFILIIVLALIGLYQLITNKIKILCFYGRIWGIALIVSTIFLMMPIKMLNFNKTIYSYPGYSDDLFSSFKKDLFFNIENPDNIEKVTIDFLNELSQSDFNSLTSEYKHITYGPNINIFYNNDMDLKSADFINSTLQKFNPLLSEYFLISEDIQVTFILKDEIALEETNTTKERLAYYNPKSDNIVIRSMSSFKEDVSIENGYEQIILHEYIHYLLNEEAKDIIGSTSILPTWFYEGISEYFVDLFRDNSLINKKSIYAGNLKNNKNFDGDNANQFYENSMYIMKYIMDKGGNKTITTILNDMKRSKDIYKSIENVIGESFEEIQKKTLINVVDN